MVSLRTQPIDSWTEETLSSLPTEDDFFEYKSSRMGIDELGNEIGKAASAFWNSGGGILIAGVNNAGIVDGGFPATHGKRQSRRDWADQVLALVQPPGPYTIKVIKPETPDSLIFETNVVLVISFEASIVVPHMAPNNKYYVRAGAHSGPASHFLVEAIRTQRGLGTPLLRALLRPSETKPQIIQLQILALSDVVALDVQLDFEPLPTVIRQHLSDLFPARIPLIDRQHPYTLDMFPFGGRSDTFGSQPVTLKLTYRDVAGREHSMAQQIDARRDVPPLKIGDPDSTAIRKSLEEISRQMKYLTASVQRFRHRNENGEAGSDESVEEGGS